MTPEEEIAARDFFSLSFAQLARELADKMEKDCPLSDGPDALRLFSCALLAGIGRESIDTRH